MSLSRETRELLARGRTGGSMPARRRSAVKGAVLAKVAAGTVVTTSATAAAWTATTKTIGVAVVALAVGGGAVGVVKHEQTKRAEASHAQAMARAAAAATPSLRANEPQIPPPPEVAELPARVPDPDRIPTQTPTLTQMQTPNPSPSQGPSPSPSQGPSPNPISPSTAPSPAASSLQAEADLLAQAHEAIAAGDPSRALDLLDRHARLYPSSVLEPERSAERVFAYCKEGAIDAAHGAVASFLSTHPTGPLADRVRSSCGGTK